MKIYNATLFDNEVKETQNDLITVLETAKEKKTYDNGDYDALFETTGYSDDDIFYYVDSSEIPKENNGKIKPGDVYDYFEIKSAKLEASYTIK